MRRRRRSSCRRSGDGGTTWQAVPEAAARKTQRYRFKDPRETDGEWIYRVRSNATIPADAVRDSYVVTTPWSEASEPVTVDRTAPELSLRCPKKVKVGKRAFARISASDAGVGLDEDPTGKRRIDTRRKGRQRIEAKAVDLLGNRNRRDLQGEGREGQEEAIGAARSALPRGGASRRRGRRRRRPRGPFRTPGALGPRPPPLAGVAAVHLGRERSSIGCVSPCSAHSSSMVSGLK